MPVIVTIATKINGFVLDAPKLDKHEHIQIDKPGGSNQQWTIVSHSDLSSVPDGYVIIYAGDESSKHLCIDIPRSNTKERTLVQRTGRRPSARTLLGLFERILADKPHPEMGYRSCLGIIRLADQYSPARMEAAAERALLSQKLADFIIVMSVLRREAETGWIIGEAQAASERVGGLGCPFRRGFGYDLAVSHQEIPPSRLFLKDAMAGKQNAAIRHRDAEAKRPGSDACACDSSTSRREASASISAFFFCIAASCRSSLAIWLSFCSSWRAWF